MTYLFRQDSISVILVNWSSGFHSTGTLLNGQEQGEWLLFDKRNRLRKSYYYTLGEINKVIEYDKKGRIKNESGLTINW